TVGGLDAGVFSFGYREHRTVTETEGEAESLGALEAARREVRADEGLVTLATRIVVENQAPGGRLVLGRGLDVVAGGVFVAAQVFQGETLHLGPRTRETVARLHGDVLVVLVLGEAVIAFSVVDDRGVDDRVRFFDKHVGLAEGHEVLGADSPDAVLGEVVTT